MSIDSDFIVFYVPEARNGEYLTDQAKAIKDVKVSKDGWLTFTTDHFSVYGIVEYPKNKAPATPNTGIAPESKDFVSTTVKVAAGFATILTTIGAAIVARRHILRKRNAKQQD